jgi:hypothetical protein
MKTNVVMKREMGGFTVNQRTEDGYFEANGLLRQWNAIPGHTRRRMDQYLALSGTKELINALLKKLSITGRSKSGDRYNQGVTIDNFQLIKISKKN